MATGKALGRDGRRWGEFSAGVGRSSAQCRAGKEGQLGTKSPAGAGLRVTEFALAYTLIRSEEPRPCHPGEGGISSRYMRGIWLPDSRS